MSQYPESYTSSHGDFTAEPSAADVARDEAAGVGQHARQAGSQVTQTATDQARQVAAETARQARDLLGEAQGQAREQASAQQQKAVQRLHSVADELRQMAANGGQAGVATEFAHQAASRLHGAASWLEQRQPADLLDEVRNFARRRPGTFLLGAAVAGIAAGRLTRGLATNGNDNGQPGTDGGTVTAVPVAIPARPGAETLPDFPAVPDAPDSGVPAYPAEPGYLPGGELSDPSAPAYPADPPYPAEPGTAPRYEGPR